MPGAGVEVGAAGAGSVVLAPISSDSAGVSVDVAGAWVASAGSAAVVCPVARGGWLARWERWERDGKDDGEGGGAREWMRWVGLAVGGEAGESRGWNARQI